MKKIILLIIITILSCQEKKQSQIVHCDDIQDLRIDYKVTNYEVKDVNYDSLAIKENSI